MKRLIAALLAAAILLSLSACGSSSTPKKKDIADITAEDLEAAAERLMEGEEAATAPANSSDEVSPIEDSFVTVEMTAENFNDYFEFVVLPVLNKWGEETGDYFLKVRSKAYDQGLLYFSGGERGLGQDFAVEIEEQHSDGHSSTYSWGENQLYQCLDGYSSHSRIKNDITYSANRVKGHLVFLKTEYIDHEEVDKEFSFDGYTVKGMKLYLKNGERRYVYWQDGMKY